MDITLLVQSVVGLVIILGILVLLFNLPIGKNDKVTAKNIPSKSAKKTDFEYLRSVVANPESSTQELGDALALIIKYHGTMHKKLGIRAHPESKAYMDVLFKLCRHKNASKDIIVKFNNDLEKLNKGYKREINDALMRGLNSRGV